jgi:energy-coupling factor transporter transmembrane protein EcfT
MFAALCALSAIVLVPNSAGLTLQIAVYLLGAALLGVLAPVLRSWRTVAWVIASLLIVYAWAYPGSTDFVWIFGVQGFLVALQIALRLLAIVTVLYTLLLATGPLAIIQWAGDVNEDLGIMLSLTLSVLPVMKQQMDTTLEVQQARGMNTSGNLIAKLRSYLAVLIPVVVKSLVRAYGMAALLHTRGYASGRRLKVARVVSAAVIATYSASALWVAGALFVRLALL